MSSKDKIIPLPIWFQIRREMPRVTKKISKQKHLKWIMTSFKTKNRKNYFCKQQRELISRISRAVAKKSHLLLPLWVFFRIQTFNRAATNLTTTLQDKTFSWRVNLFSRMTIWNSKLRKKPLTLSITMALLITKAALSRLIHFHQIYKYSFHQRWRLTSKRVTRSQSTMQWTRNPTNLQYHRRCSKIDKSQTSNICFSI